MLQPEYIRKITDAAEMQAERLRSKVMQQIIGRVVARIDSGEEFFFSATDKWQSITLQESGMLLEDVSKLVGAYLDIQAVTILNAFQDSAIQNWKYDSAIYKKAGLDVTDLKESPYYIRLLQRNYEKTHGDMINMTGTFASQAQSLFIQTVSDAYFSVAAGAESYTSAVLDAVQKISKQSLYVSYDSGHRDRVEVATLRCVRTGVSQTAAEITMQRMMEMDYDLVQVSAHMGARPEHALWQGKQYSLNGKTPGYAKLADATGYGTVTGLCGANCRHSFGPAIPGMNPYEKTNMQENNKLYDLLQEQRRQEREIRRARADLQEWQAGIDAAQSEKTTSTLQRAYERKAYNLEMREKKYKDYCEENDFKKLYDRLSTAGCDSKQANQATKAAAAYAARKGL